MIDRICDYSGRDVTDVAENLDRIAKVAIGLIREQVASTATVLDVKSLLADYRNDILSYLPASLQIGSLLNDNTLDDRTHKMEGPVSSLMHAIGDSFSGSSSDKTNISK